MAHMKQAKSANGNTRKDIRARYVFFTWFIDSDNAIDTILNYISGNPKNSYIFQKEICPSSGRLHLQGFLCFKNAHWFQSIKDRCNGIHLEKAKNKIACINYCQKIETSIEDVYHKGFDQYINRCPCYLNIDIMYQWQLIMTAIVNNYHFFDPENKKIIWLYEKTGGVGKSSWCKETCNVNKRALCIGGKASDMKYGIVSMMDKKGVPPTLCIIDLARNDKIDYIGLEEIKNGFFFSTKYESSQVIMKSPIVIIFSNEEPDISMLSIHKWEIGKIEDNDITWIDPLSIKDKYKQKVKTMREYII